MSELKKKMMRRGMSSEEADAEISYLKEEMYVCAENNDLYGAEELLIENGLDLDYMIDLL